MSEQRTADKKLAITRRADKAQTAILDAPARKMEAVTRDNLLEVLTLQATESTRDGALEGALLIATKISEVTNPVLAQLHSLVPDLANSHKVPTSVSVSYNDMLADITAGQFDTAVKVGVANVEFSVTRDSVTSTVAPNDLFSTVFAPVLDLANKLISERADLAHDREDLQTSAQLTEAQRVSAYDERSAELESEATELKSALAAVARRAAVGLKFVLNDGQTISRNGLEGVLKAVGNRLEEFESALKIFTGDLPLAKSEILDSEVRSLEEKRDGLLLEVADIESKRDLIKAELGPLEKAKARAESDLKIARDSYRDVSNRGDTLNKRVKPLAEDLAAKEKRVGELATTIDEKTRESERLEGLLTEKTRRVSELDAEISRKSVDLEDANREINHARVMAQTIVSDAKTEAEGIVRTATERAAEIAAANAQATVSSSDAEAKLAEAERRLAEMTGLKVAQERRADTAVARAQNAELRQSEESNRANAATARATNAEGRETAAKNEATALSLENARLLGANKGLSYRNAELEGTNADLQRQLGELRAQLAAANAVTAPVPSPTTISTRGPVQVVSAPVASPTVAPSPVVAPVQPVAPTANNDTITHGAAVEGPSIVEFKINEFVMVPGRSDIKLKIKGYKKQESLIAPAQVSVEVTYARVRRNGSFEWATVSNNVMDSSSEIKTDVLTLNSFSSNGNVTRSLKMSLMGYNTDNQSGTLSIEVTGNEVVEPTKTVSQVVDMTPVTKLVSDLTPVLSGIAIRLGAKGVQDAKLDVIDSVVPIDAGFDVAKKRLADKLSALVDVAVEKAGADRAGSDKVVSDLRAMNGDSKAFVSAYVTALKAIHAALYDSALTSDDDNTAVEGLN